MLSTRQCKVSLFIATRQLKRGPSVDVFRPPVDVDAKAASRSVVYQLACLGTWIGRGM